MTAPPDAKPRLPRSDPATIVAIALVAYALCDLTHEVLGHGVATLISPGVRAVSLSSVALQTEGINSRMVAAAGTIANVVVGGLAFSLFLLRPRLTPGAWFLWLFGLLNLMNGTGYLVFTALFGFGDWAVVMDGLTPAWLWRVGLGLVGVASYWLVLKVAAIELAMTGWESYRRSDTPRLALTSYFAGGTLLLVASIFNPISPSLILASGASSGFAAMAGLLYMPTLLRKFAIGGAYGDDVIARSRGWIIAGAVVTVVFVGVIGRGIRF